MDRDVLVRPVPHEQVHEALVREVVGDDVQLHVVRDARAAEIEVAEMDGHEDHTALAREPFTEVLPPLHMHELGEVEVVELRESHDLGHVLREVAERAARDPRDVGMVVRLAEHDREVRLRDLAPARPGEVRELAQEHGARIGEPCREPLHERSGPSVQPVRRPLDETAMQGRVQRVLAAVAPVAPVRVRASVPAMNDSTASRASSSGICWGGDFMKYDAGATIVPPSLRSSASFAQRIASMTTPALFGESQTSSFNSRFSGTSPKVVPSMRM